MEFWESLIVWLHLLLFRLLARRRHRRLLFTSFFRNNPKYDVETRTLLSRITGDIDMAPRTTMVLMVPTGFSVAAIHGYLTISSMWLIAFWIFGAAWLVLVWWLHLEKDAAKKAPWAKFDLRLRWVLMLAFVAFAISSFISERTDHRKLRGAEVADLCRHHRLRHRYSRGGQAVHCGVHRDQSRRLDARARGPAASVRQGGAQLGQGHLGFGRSRGLHRDLAARLLGAVLDDISGRPLGFGRPYF